MCHLLYAGAFVRCANWLVKLTTGTKNLVLEIGLTLRYSIVIIDSLGEAAVGVGRANLEGLDSANGQAPVARETAQALRRIFK